MVTAGMRKDLLCADGDRGATMTSRARTHGRVAPVVTVTKKHHSACSAAHRSGDVPMKPGCAMRTCRGGRRQRRADGLAAVCPAVAAVLAGTAGASMLGTALL